MVKTVTFEIYAAPGDKFAPDAFADAIGKTLDVRLGDGAIVAGRVLNAEVNARGTAVAIDVEIPTEKE